MRFGKSVPGANVLAYIAAKDPVIKMALIRRRDLIFEFNGKIGNTLAPIHHIGLYYGLCGAGIYAGGTTAAVVHNGMVVGQVQVYDEFGNKVKRPELLGEQIAVLPYPAKATPGRPHFIKHRRRIYKNTAMDLPYRFVNESQQGFKFFPDDIVIVLAIGVFGYFIAIRALLFFRVVIVEKRDYGSGAGDKLGRVESFIKMVFHIRHLPMPAFF